MGMHSVNFEGWTTKSAVQVFEQDNPAHAKDPNAPAKLKYAFVTLMQKRDYTVVKKDVNGNVVMKDGVAEREAVSDAITLKFRNSAAENIAKYKADGVARHLWVKATVSTYKKELTYVMIPQGNKLVKQDLFAVVDGKKVPLKHVVNETIYEVDEYRFLDANPNSAVSTESVTVTPDMTIVIGDAPSTTPNISVSDNTVDLPAFNPVEYTPAIPGEF